MVEAADKMRYWSAAAVDLRPLRIRAFTLRWQGFDREHNARLKAVGQLAARGGIGLI